MQGLHIVFTSYIGFDSRLLVRTLTPAAIFAQLNIVASYLDHYFSYLNDSPPLRGRCQRMNQIRKIDHRIIQMLEDGDRNTRLMVFEDEPVYFALYYFPHFFNYAIPQFHFDFYFDIKRMLAGEIEEAAWIAFRESAKTSIAKLALVIYSICFQKKKYINWDAYDKGNAEAALFDIVVELQTNEKLIADFGQLYYKKKHRDTMEEAKLKRISNFITENGIKVEAWSTQESTRGRIYKNVRPDLYILDDFETSKTKDSYPITKKIIDHIDEMRTGLGVNGTILYLGNYLTEEGSVAHVLNRLAGNERAMVRNVPVMFKDGTITWPGKYCATNEETAKINEIITIKEKRRVSLEYKKKSYGNKLFATEMLNDPSKSGDYYGDRDRLKKLLEACREPSKEIGGIRIWANYDPMHRYAGGGDTASGWGGDSNAGVWIDFSRRPALVVATYKDADIKPGPFARILMRGAQMYGECFLVPEQNNTGFATIFALITDEREGGCGYTNVYVREVKHKITGKAMKEYGFWSSDATKPDVIAAFFKAVEDGDLEIFDKDLLNEMYHYKKMDVRVHRPEEGMTRHFDLLTAATLAWEGNKHAKVSVASRVKQFKSPTQGAYVP